MRRQNTKTVTATQHDADDYSWAYAEDCPAATAHFDSHDGYFPDQMCDDGHYRQKRGRPILTALEKLQAISPNLIFCTRLLPEFEGRRLYCKKTLKEAKKLAQDIIARSGSTVGLWKLERGRNMMYHLHLVLAADSDISEVDHAKEVDNLKGLASYLSKPADARATKPEPADLSRYSPEELAALRVKAAEEYLTLRRKYGERFRFWGVRGLG